MADKSSQDSGEHKATKIYTTPENHPFFCPTPGEITRLALTPNKIGEAPDEDTCIGMADCGFNAASVWFADVVSNSKGEYPKVDSTIKNCRDCGIAPFINAYNLLRNETTRKALVSAYASCEGLAGWSIPTPVYKEIDTSGTRTKEYTDIWQTDKDTDPTSRHIIIMAAHANATNAEDNYRDYLIRFQDNIGPSEWYTAVHPAVIPKSGISFNDYDLFFRDLQIFSLMSRYCERPFWYTVCCMSYRDADGNSTPYPTLGEMRFSAFSSLAYGAQGLVYWSYRVREDEPTVFYQNAPLDRNGNKETAIWDAVKTVNSEVKALNSVFFESFLVDARHTGSKQYDATSMLKGSFGPLISLITEDAGVLVSHLNTNGQDYLVIVNHTFRDGEADYQKITLNFADAWTVKQIKAVNGAAVETAVSSKTLSLDLPRAGYLVFKWN